MASQHQQARIGKRIVLFPIPLQGHLNPMFELGNILFTRGFSISIIHTTFNAPNPTHHPDFTFHPIRDSIPNTPLGDGVMGLFTALNVNCVGPFRDLVKGLMEDGGERVVCLVTDAFWWFSQGVADELGVKRIVLRTANVASFLVIARFPLLKEKGYLPLKGMVDGFVVHLYETQFEERIPELPPIKVKDIPRVPSTDPELTYQFLTKVCEQIKLSDGLIFNSFEELEDSELLKTRQVFGIPLYLLGPFHKAIKSSTTSLLQPDESCITWLDKQAPKSVLYVSFGSVAAINGSEFEEIAWGLANSKVPFLWVVRPGLVRGSSAEYPLPDGFLDEVKERAYIVKWAPQMEVLAHPATGGFWTHSGWNSTLESICEGVPMICLPHFADQMVNARYASEVWKVGILMESALVRGEVEKAIKKLMVEEGGQVLRDNVIGLKEKASVCLKEGGSSYKALKSLTDRILSSLF
ncbi:UDP-glycosyltransferase 76B1-like protein [Drosera capensis]